MSVHRRLALFSFAQPRWVLIFVVVQVGQAVAHRMRQGGNRMTDNQKQLRTGRQATTWHVTIIPVGTPQEGDEAQKRALEIVVKRFHANQSQPKG